MSALWAWAVDPLHSPQPKAATSSEAKHRCSIVRPPRRGRVSPPPFILVPTIADGPSQTVHTGTKSAKINRKHVGLGDLHGEHGSHWFFNRSPCRILVRRYFS